MPTKCGPKIGNFRGREHRVAVIFGGQPGLGKSAAVDAAMLDYSRTTLSIVHDGVIYNCCWGFAHECQFLNHR